MEVGRGRGVGVVVATGLLLAATVGLASLPPRPLRSALTVLHTLTFRVATDWLAVVALLSVAGRSVRADVRVTRLTVGALAAGVFLGGVAIEASPLARLVAAPSAVETTVLVEGLLLAVHHALYPTGLFLAVVGGAAATRRRSGPARTATGGGPPLAPSEGRVPDLSRRAVASVLAVFGVVSAVSFALESGTRLAVGAPYPWLAAADAGVAAVGAGVGYAVLAGAFLVLTVEGVSLRSLAGTTAAVWVALALAGIAGGVATAGLGVALVGVTGTPMPAVGAAGFGRWPAPHSWATLLRVGTLLAGGVGLLAVERTARAARSTRREAAVERADEADVVDPTGSGDPAGTNAGER